MCVVFLQYNMTIALYLAFKKMKNILFILMLLAISPLTFSQADNTLMEEDFSWLTGSWERVNDNPKNKTTEFWEKISSQEWKGLGLTVQDTDTVFMEHMKISKREDDLYLNVSTPGNSEPIDFKITKHDKSSFIAENPAHDFPNKISYELTTAGIKATVSGSGKTIDFIFKRTEN